MARKKQKKKTLRIPRVQWVYIMSNASMPGLLKIGMTTTSPQQRKGELGSATGVPMPFKLEYSLKVSNALKVEQALHEELKAYRVNRRREFFELDLNTAVKALKSVARQGPGDLRPMLRPLSWILEMLTAAIFLALLAGLWEHFAG